MSASLRRPLLIVLALALAVPAVAFAARPKSGEWAGTVTSKKLPSGQFDGEGTTHFAVAADRKWVKGSSVIKGTISAPSYQAKCVQTLVVKAKKIAIKNGRFSYKGKAYVAYFTNKKLLGDLTWTGKWTTASKVSGTIRLKTSFKIGYAGSKPVKRRGKCDTGLLKWRAKPGTQPDLR